MWRLKQFTRCQVQVNTYIHFTEQAEILHEKRIITSFVRQIGVVRWLAQFLGLQGWKSVKGAGQT